MFFSRCGNRHDWLPPGGSPLCGSFHVIIAIMISRSGDSRHMHRSSNAFGYFHCHTSFCFFLIVANCRRETNHLLCCLQVQKTSGFHPYPQYVPGSMPPTFRSTGSLSKVCNMIRPTTQLVLQDNRYKSIVWSVVGAIAELLYSALPPKRVPVHQVPRMPD